VIGRVLQPVRGAEAGRGCRFSPVSPDVGLENLQVRLEARRRLEVSEIHGCRIALAHTIQCDGRMWSTADCQQRLTAIRAASSFTQANAHMLCSACVYKRSAGLLEVLDATGVRSGCVTAAAASTYQVAAARVARLSAPLSPHCGCAWSQQSPWGAQSCGKKAPLSGSGSSTPRAAKWRSKQRCSAREGSKKQG